MTRVLTTRPPTPPCRDKVWVSWSTVAPGPSGCRRPAGRPSDVVLAVAVRPVGRTVSRSNGRRHSGHRARHIHHRVERHDRHGVESDFGANDWLLEEMYERFTADPSSVDASWAELLRRPRRARRREPRRRRQPAASRGDEARRGDPGGPEAATGHTAAARRRHRPAERRQRTAPADRATAPARPGRDADLELGRRRPGRRPGHEPPASGARGDARPAGPPRAAAAPADRRDDDPGQGGPPDRARRARRASPPTRRTRPTGPRSATRSPRSRRCAAPPRARPRTWTPRSASRRRPASARCRSSC